MSVRKPRRSGRRVGGGARRAHATPGGRRLAGGPRDAWGFGGHEERQVEPKKLKLTACKEAHQLKLTECKEAERAAKAKEKCTRFLHRIASSVNTGGADRAALMKC